ncbi:MAG: Fe(3+) ABC transporter substrate-binding protein [Acidobacteriota bacterium]
MLRHSFLALLVLLVLLAAVACSPGPSQETAEEQPAAENAASQELNVYSSRHYDNDQVLIDRFEEETGIQVNIIEGDSAALLERLRREGDQSPADVFVAVDAGRLHLAELEGVFAPVESEVLNERVPENLRHPEGLWFGLTKRARVIVYAKDRVQPEEISSYEQLAEPTWKDRVLIRSSTNIYNQSLVGSILAAHGEEVTEEWCKGVVANMARDPQGGDTDQIRAVAAGEGDVAVVNTYYLGRLLGADDKPEDQEVAAKIGIVFPNQDDRGTHVNISGAGVVKNAPNRENAIRFLEFLTSPESQEVFAGANKEYSIVAGAAPIAELAPFGEFKEDALNASVFAANNKQALMIMDRCGWR